MEEQRQTGLKDRETNAKRRSKEQQDERESRLELKRDVGEENITRNGRWKDESETIVATTSYKLILTFILQSFSP